MTKPNGRGKGWRMVPVDETYTVDENGCWLWTLHRNVDGYGHVERGGFAGGAHRWMWVEKQGPIPDGLTIDHLCRVRACVNPDHMELVTGPENTRRGNGIPSLNGRKETCKAGHPFDEANTYRYTRNGQPARACRTCNRRRSQKHYAKNQAQFEHPDYVSLDAVEEKVA